MSAKSFQYRQFIPIEAVGRGCSCASIKLSAEGGRETAKRFKAPGQLRVARRAAGMEQEYPRPAADNELAVDKVTGKRAFAG